MTAIVTHLPRESANVAPLHLNVIAPNVSCQFALLERVSAVIARLYRVDGGSLQASNIPRQPSSRAHSAGNKTDTPFSQVPSYMPEHPTPLERGINRAGAAAAAAAAGGTSSSAAGRFLALTRGRNPGRGGGTATARPLPATASVVPPSTAERAAKVSQTRAPSDFSIGPSEPLNNKGPSQPPTGPSSHLLGTRQQQQTSFATTTRRLFDEIPSLIAGKVDSAAMLPLSPRCEAIGTAGSINGVEGTNASAVRTPGVQAASRCPLVPQPSSPRVRAESHPWCVRGCSMFQGHCVNPFESPGTPPALISSNCSQKRVSSRKGVNDDVLGGMRGMNSILKRGMFDACSGNANA